MLPFVLRRLASGVVLVFVISLLAYTLLYLGGGDIARRILGQNASQATVDQKAQELGLDQPLLAQFWDWLTSRTPGRPRPLVVHGPARRPGVSGRLAVTLSHRDRRDARVAIISVVLGVLAARRGGWIDGLVQFITVIGFAIPGFLIALYLVLVFADQPRWFKATGYIPFTTSPSGWLASVTLPIIALVLRAPSPASPQQVRGSVLDALRRDYVRTLRSRGLG